MEKKLFYLIVIAVVIIVILAGLFISMNEPGVSVTDIRFKSFSVPETSISFYVDLDIDNDNFVGATLNKVEADIYVDGDFFGTTYSEEDFEIGANEVSPITVVLKISNVPISALSKNSVEVQLIGTAYLKVGLFTFEVPIDKVETVGLG
jgi:LEA14-like dessication related protein